MIWLCAYLLGMAATLVVILTIGIYDMRQDGMSWKGVVRALTTKPHWSRFAFVLVFWPMAWGWAFVEFFKARF